MVKIKLLLALLALTLCANSLLYTFAAAEEDASSAIAAAEDRIVDCYRAVAEADEAGANVTSLLASLGESGWLLAKARLACSIGDLDSAVDFANQSRAKLEEIVSEADLLTSDALQSNYWDFAVNFVGSIAGAVVVVLSGLLVWTLLKRRYGDNVTV